VPDPDDPPEGCRFHPRCPIAVEECSDAFPEFEEHDGNHVRCIRVEAAEEMGSRGRDEATEVDVPSTTPPAGEDG
jgi:hypothetical protein